ncbi:MAG TPA: CcmD family protein [Vicinamibacterales bacterium]|nr:CcmD family protein [Vicinamibacterales bacterium]
MVRQREVRRRVGRFVRTLFLVLVLGLVPTGSAEGGIPQPPAPAAQEGFVPVDQLPPDEQLPAAPLLIAAYAVAWLAVFGYLWSVWQRLSRVEREIAEVSRRIEAGARR